ncbi:MAG: hypothetical protein ACREH5_00460 [Candidatus Omnitrophota bacterium]
MLREDLHCIGRQVFLNECAGYPKNLVFWSPNESFPSLGIGHFIWYPEGSSEPFRESFPDLVRFFRKNRVEFPEWLWDSGRIRLPWRVREEFMEEGESERVLALRDLLERTWDLQVFFMLERSKRSIGKILSATPPAERAPLFARFHRLSSFREGAFALLDYVNFKGEGYKTSERYEGYGWGLKQVLEEMDEESFIQDPLREFVRTALDVLERRVKYSPLSKKEHLWLPGWRKRVQSYSTFQCP